jgi:SAM-dependent methyltransferase
MPFGGGPQTMNTVDNILNRNLRAEAERRGYIVGAPAAPDGHYFFEEGDRIFPEFLKLILADYKIRDNKFHIAGASNGGNAALPVAAGGVRACELLQVAPDDSVLEIGFGPGVTIDHLSRVAPAGHIAGIDQSREMVEQGRARNVAAIRSGRVDLRHGSVESLPFDDNSFDSALAVNSMQVWSDAVAGLREIRRVMRPGAKIALAFTPYSGQPRDGLTEALIASGFVDAHVVEIETGFFALATNA